jgi:catechol 2,3-dioxygenase-like lactoylglutathione lyase family enzyme
MSDSMSERGLRHIALKTRDLEASERFYIDVLGFERMFLEEGNLFLQTPSGGDILNLIGTEERFDPSAGGFSHFGIHVLESDWNQLPAQLEQAGVPIQEHRGKVAIYIEDPNGYTVELYKD